ncbi:UDP-N-acetyl-D-mannosamine dehydrogenase [Corynebacterium sp.]|uniref:UDP-N-acetyl-D-mannosamine dehydrogenase n=1 Tax=Corynebacterium sp. TaxID=1720 RepID=UPI0026DB154F|nr:UDP-N-acetyl-D-mannosamine dehydrogenase [Corynebacterium sp.]MDO5031012.1 UDP-N-acetyl-D-mannosamine dehydrogenase [Corynebacterium sp.]
MHISFVGLGYIGLPTAVVLANAGHDVTGVDINESNVEKINKGEVTIVEPGLEGALNEALESGRFRATTEQVHADAYVVAVPTPFQSDHSVDMTYIYAAAEGIAPHLEGGELIVLESTSPPRTTEKMARRILDLRPDLRADVVDAEAANDALLFAHCPERILPGRALEELRSNDRIIGGMTPRATAAAREVYGSFCEGELLESNAITAEMAKLTENSFRDVNIAFANELSVIAHDLGVDVWELISLANHHPRVNILQPGPGVGGHCIAVYPWFIVAADRENSKLIRTAREVNDSKPLWVIERVKEAIAATGATELAILGLSFKANIDDLRESPSLAIAESLANELPDVRHHVVEPNIHHLPARLAGFPNVTLSSIDDAVSACKVCVLLVDHDEFRYIPREMLSGKTVIDTKGIWR